MIGDYPLNDGFQLQANNTKEGNKQMIFSSFQFVLGFFPIVFIGYTILNKCCFDRLAKIWLVCASLYFYAQGSFSFFPFFVGSIFANYVIGSGLGKLYSAEGKCTQAKILLLIGILGNVALLGYYKYTDFFIENYNFVTGSGVPLKNIVLPIGISFFTFQLIAFLVDSYRGKCESYDVLEYLLFITFFPQLIVGPIVHHAEVIPQFRAKENSKLNYGNMARGLFLFSIGCFKKIYFADILTRSAQGYFDGITAHSILNMVDTWYHAIEYTISYYFDLSGYADMAIGLGLMFNIIIPHNFNSPYKARNFQDYWRRWHMTLSRFLGDYIFRSVYRKNDKYRNFYVATIITFLVSGFWHGAGWTFVVWGLINGLLVCTASWMKQHEMKLPAFFAYLLTAIGIVFTRVLFISPSFAYAWNVYKGMISWEGLDAFWSAICSLFIGTRAIAVGLVLLTGIVVCWVLPNSRELGDRFKPTVPTVVFAAGLLMLCVFRMGKTVSFLYFQF